MRRALRRALCCAPLALGACTVDDRPPGYTGSWTPPEGGATDGGGGLDVGYLDGPPSPDAAGLCGNEFVPVVIDRPNLYFVVDRSGSMAEPMGGGTRFEVARVAISRVLQKVGHRVSYGAAVFPYAPTADFGCTVGQEVFATRAGDALASVPDGGVGSTLRTLLLTLSAAEPAGGTPTAASLEALRPTLEALPGRTFVVLATDGAPNCNALGSCEAEACLLNLEQITLAGNPPLVCEAPVNCCDPATVVGGPYQCLDELASVRAVQALSEAGIATYVVGMPGTERYGAVLDAMAVVGGTARPGTPRYYSTSNEAELGDALLAIGVEVSVSCTVDLGAIPPDPLMVNVYLDRGRVWFDEVDGWTWVDADTLELRGEACALLKSGDVAQVQVVSGCPTEIR